jgi:RNA polymerase sigma-70 factor (ECF subfamily)
MTRKMPRPGRRSYYARPAAIPDPVAALWGGCTEDAVAFEKVYQLHYQEVVSFLRRLGASREDAEEAAQEAFLVVLLRIAQLDDPSRFPQWIRVIARNTWYDHLRRRSNKRCTFEEPCGPQELVRLEPAGRDCGPEEWAEDADAVRRVCQMAESFPERMREAFNLYFLHQHTTNEIASLMDVSPRTVSGYLHEARRRIRDWWLATEQRDELDLTRLGSYRSSQPQSTRPKPKSAPKAAARRPRTWKATLPSVREREVLKLSDQGLTPAQIAKQLDISANNARVTLCHAKKKRQPQAA